MAYYSVLALPVLISAFAVRHVSYFDRSAAAAAADGTWAKPGLRPTD
jgi:hypothetical protein